MRLDLQDHVSRMIYFLGSHEPQETALFRRMVRPDWVVVDVGAHIGYYTLLASRLIDCTQGRVYAFEPNPTAFQLLRYHIEINDVSCVTAINMALGAQAGQVRLFLGPARNTGLASMFSSPLTAVSLAVSVTTLDDFANSHRLQRVDFIKIDVEGAEIDVLAGARNVLRSYHPRLMVEVNADAMRRAGHRSRDMAVLLHEMGYRLFRVDRPGTEVTLRDIEASRFVNIYAESRP